MTLDRRNWISKLALLDVSQRVDELDPPRILWGETQGEFVSGLPEGYPLRRIWGEVLAEVSEVVFGVARP